MSPNHSRKGVRIETKKKITEQLQRITPARECVLKLRNFNALDWNSNHSRKGVRIETAGVEGAQPPTNHSRKGVRIETHCMIQRYFCVNHSRKGVRIETAVYRKVFFLESLPQGSAY